METNKIKFITDRVATNLESPSKPGPTSKNLPDWYKQADRFAINPGTGEYWPDGFGGKMPTWKACPAMFDIMGTGYLLKTPCDINFYLDANNKIKVFVEDERYNHFCTERPPMAQFLTPVGYYEDHFAWFPDWAVILPEGYSALYASPFNRYDLPFLMVSGIIDNDKVNLPGTLPFFLPKGYQGKILAGTPYAQVIPFRRENWESECIEEDPNALEGKWIANSEKYRVPNGGVYKNEVWERRKYT